MSDNDLVLFIICLHYWQTNTPSGVREAKLSQWSQKFQPLSHQVAHGKRGEIRQ